VKEKRVGGKRNTVFFLPGKRGEKEEGKGNRWNKGREKKTAGFSRSWKRRKKASEKKRKI